MLSKYQIIESLRKWINQRPGLEFGSYGDWAAYRSELRSIARDRRDALELLQAVTWRDGITAEHLIAASKSAYGGRLTIAGCMHGDAHKVTCGANSRHVWCEACDPAPSALCHWCHGRGYSDAQPGVVKIDYVTGQYWPTEYRRAACAVLASALWDNARDCMPEPVVKHYGSATDHPMQTVLLYDGLRAGDWLRRHFRREFGRGIASRWFN